MARMAGGGKAETGMDVFVRGVLSGALVGAVIAGSTIWERRRRAAARALEPVTPEAGLTGDGPALSPREGSGPQGSATASPEGSAAAG